MEDGRRLQWRTYASLLVSCVGVNVADACRLADKMCAEEDKRFGVLGLPSPTEKEQEQHGSILT